MKGKKLLGIISLGLFAAVSVGAGVGLSQKVKAVETKAYGKDDKTWFLCHEGNSWIKNSAADHFSYKSQQDDFYEFANDNFIELAKDEKFNIVYSWNEGAGYNTFTPVLSQDQSEETVFTVPDGKDYAVAARAIKVKFYFQFKGEGATETKLYWQEYSEPDVPEEDGYYIVGTKSNWKFAGATKMDPGTDGNKAQLLEYQGTAGEKFKARSYINGVDTWYGDADYVVGEADKLLDIYVNSNDELYVEEHPDVPEEDGYYLVSSKTNFKYDGATKMTQVDPYMTGNVATLTYNAEAGEKVKVRSYFNGVDKWSDNIDGEKTYGETDEDKNFVFSVGESYDIYAFYNEDSFEFSVAPEAEKVTITLAAKMYDGKHSQGEQTIGQYVFVKGVKYSVPAIAREGYAQLDTYTDFDCTNKFVNGTSIENNVLLHVKYMELAFYLTGDDTFSGGTGKGWNVEYSTKIQGDGNNKLVGAVEVPEGISEEEPMEVKPLQYVADAGEGKPGWAAVSYTMGHEVDPDFVHIGTKEGHEGNFVFTKSGTYAFYVNNEDKVYFNGGEYAFHEKFLSDMAAVCDEAKGNTDPDELKDAWDLLEIAFNKLSDEEQKNIYDVGYGKGDPSPSADARLRMVASYSYICTKYGTSVCKDYIWGQTLSPATSVSTLGNGTFDQNNSVLIAVVSVIAVTSISAIAVLLVIKRRKSI
jgi:hypothetical protein